MNTSNLATRGLLALFLLAIAFAKLINPNPYHEYASLLNSATAFEVVLGIVLISRHWQIAAWSGILLGAFGILVDQLGILNSFCGCLGGLEQVPGMKTMTAATIGILSVAALKTGHPQHTDLANGMLDQTLGGDLGSRATNSDS